MAQLRRGKKTSGGWGGCRSSVEEVEVEDDFWNWDFLFGSRGNFRSDEIGA
jgi:hypothetical protein